MKTHTLVLLTVLLFAVGVRAQDSSRYFVAVSANYLPAFGSNHAEPVGPGYNGSNWSETGPFAEPLRPSSGEGVNIEYGKIFSDASIAVELSAMYRKPEYTFDTIIHQPTATAGFWIPDGAQFALSLNPAYKLISQAYLGISVGLAYQRQDAIFQVLNRNGSIGVNNVGQRWAAVFAYGADLKIGATPFLRLSYSSESGFGLGFISTFEIN